MMTPSEIAFLQQLGCTPADVYDGRNQPKSTWQSKAKSLGAEIVFGTPCTKAGHRLRSRAGHCIQCNTGVHAYQVRHNASQYVYIAGSQTKRLIKVGTTSSVERRSVSLRSENYGGASDWVMLCSIKVQKAGELERCIGDRLRQWAITIEYDKQRKAQKASEIYRTSYSIARAAFDAETTLLRGEQLWTNLRLHCSKHEFD